jgi:hypothetical protein
MLRATSFPATLKGHFSMSFRALAPNSAQISPQIRQEGLCSSPVPIENPLWAQQPPGLSPQGVQGAEISNIQRQLDKLTVENTALKAASVAFKAEAKAAKQKRREILGKAGVSNKIVPDNAPEHFKNLAVALHHCVTSSEAPAKVYYGKDKGLAMIFDFVENWLYKGATTVSGVHADSTGDKKEKQNDAAAYFAGQYFIRHKIDPLDMARTMDMDGVALNQKGVEQVRHVLRDYAPNKRLVVPSGSCIGETQRLIENDAAKSLQLQGVGSEMHTFDPTVALPMFHEDFLGKEIDRCEVAVTGDGTPLCTYTPYTACGLKLVDYRLPAVIEKGVQSCWNYFPFIHGMFNETGEEGVEKMRKFHKDTFEFFDETNVKCVAVADLKYQWTMTGKGGSSECGYFCTGCDVHAATKGEGQAFSRTNARVKKAAQDRE